MNDIPIKLIALPNNAEQFLTLFCTPTSQYILGKIQHTYNHEKKIKTYIRRRMG